MKIKSSLVVFQKDKLSMWYGIITGTWRQTCSQFILNTHKLKSIPRPSLLGRFSDAIVQNKFSIWMTTWLSKLLDPFLRRLSFFLKSSPGILGHQCVTIDCSVPSVHAVSYLRALWLTAYQHCPWIQYFHLLSTSQLRTRRQLTCAPFNSFSALGVWRSVSLCLPFVSRKFTVTTLNFDQFDKAGQFCCVFLLLNYYFFHSIGNPFVARDIIIISAMQFVNSYIFNQHLLCQVVQCW